MEFTSLGLLTLMTSWTEQEVDGNDCQFYQWSEPRALHQLYVSLIQPHLEYAAPVWDPWLSKDIQRIEAAQKCALRVCLKDRNSPYDDLLTHCGLCEHARGNSVYAISTEFCKRYVLIPVLRSASTIITITRSHKIQADIWERLQACTNIFFSSFFPRTIWAWNSLPQCIITSTQTITAFKWYTHHV